MAALPASSLPSTGANVLAADQSDAMQATADSITGAGGRAIALVKDASSESDVKFFIGGLAQRRSRSFICSPTGAMVTAMRSCASLPSGVSTRTMSKLASSMAIAIFISSRAR